MMTVPKIEFREEVEQRNLQEGAWPKMVEVFKTNVEGISQAQKLVALLLQHFPGSKINFDLDDCDNILRVEGRDFVPVKVKQLLEANGFYCWVLE
jgi:hypothetical protein